MNELAPRDDPSLERGRMFDRVAQQYADARPGYPDALFARLFELAALAPRARVLEIGCGPAQATLPFAQRGLRLICLEPGQELAKLARERLRAFPDVSVETVSFEDWPLQPRAFDLVFAAQSLHWIPPAVSLPKAADALRADGGLALFWNRPADQDAPYRAGFEEAYRRFAPDLQRGKPAQPLESFIASWRGAIDASRRFGAVTVERFPWTTEYDRAGYVRLLETFSDHLVLPAPVRAKLHDRIGQVIEDLGGRITMPRTTVLFFARASNDTTIPAVGIDAAGIDAVKNDAAGNDPARNNTTGAADPGSRGARGR